MIFQDPYSSLNPRMTVGEIIGEGLRLTAGPHEPRRFASEVGDWLVRVGLERRPRVALPARVLGRPTATRRHRAGTDRASRDFVVCDEPISALDVSVQAQIVRLLGELKSSLGLTMLFIAHDLSMVRYVSDRMAVMYLGSLVEIGPADEVFSRPLAPVHADPDRLQSRSPTRAAERRRTATTIEGEIASPINVGVGCRFAARCPKVMDVCRTVTPALQTVERTSARRVACHLYPPV